MEKGLTKKIIAGDERAAARLMRAIDDDLPEAIQELSELYLLTGHAHIIGITGAPGVGKSTLINSIITELRKRDMTVGVVPVDPSSPFTGGALLGDRIRMDKHSNDRAVFIHSLASRGWSGGLARAVSGVVYILDAMGKDIILVEAVGSGQNEVSIQKVADTTVVILTPGMGDEIQLMKAGILETADIFVINKSDMKGAEMLRVQLETMCDFNQQIDPCWKPCIILTQAISDSGVVELTDALIKHKEFLRQTGHIRHKHLVRANFMMEEAIKYAIEQRVLVVLKGKQLKTIVECIADRKIDPYAAAKQIIQLSGIVP
jgi:LAO/AO transport system kinase